MPPMLSLRFLRCWNELPLLPLAPESMPTLPCDGGDNVAGRLLWLMVLTLLRLGVLAADLLPPQCPNEFLLVKVGGGFRE